MRFATYQLTDDETGRDRVGVAHGDQLYEIPGAGRLVDLLDDAATLRDAGGLALREPASVVELTQARLRAPIPTPPSVRDFMTFEQHIVGTSLNQGPNGRPPKVFYRQPLFYFTNPVATIGPDDDVPVPPGSRSFDFELEVAAVIGRPGANLSVEQAGEHIIGYTILVDWSARDLQFREMQGDLGPAKGKDTATTLGPYLVTADELAPFASGPSFSLAMEIEVNGKPFGADRLDNMGWSFAQMVAYAARGTRVVTGDVLGCGTCGNGCLAEKWGRQDAALPKEGLRVGDVLTFRVEHLGEITQRIVEGPPLLDIGPCLARPA
ncbi:fumarylacetoacetate hydrolase family protein [Parafrankia elaeagni]|uniref:fumarylacetoacetate hydrolase family protein n=1 Tax=Parafrankia elaeagni TaxID=222534 RepID=UPI0003773BF4|nr:fumarylacetoacetate hydrolase family protein [Parafrankia elaeagni]